MTVSTIHKSSTDWEVSDDVDFELFLSTFYSDYNEEKVALVPAILREVLPFIVYILSA